MSKGQIAAELNTRSHPGTEEKIAAILRREAEAAAQTEAAKSSDTSESAE